MEQSKNGLDEDGRGRKGRTGRLGNRAKKLGWKTCKKWSLTYSLTPLKGLEKMGHRGLVWKVLQQSVFEVA